LLPVPPSLETRTKRGFPHFHSDDGARRCLAIPAPETGTGETLEVQATRWLQRADDIYAASTANGDVRGQVQSLTAAFRGLELQHRSEQREAAAPESDGDAMTLQEIDKILAKWDRVAKSTDERTSQLAISKLRQVGAFDLYEVFTRVWDQPALKQRLLRFLQ
jgi:hypothetical protein